MRRLLLALGVALAACSSDGDGGEAEAGPGPTESCPTEPDGNGFFRLESDRSDYWVRLPPGYDSAAPTPQPLVVGLHGCGDSAQNFLQWAIAPGPLRATQGYIALSLGGKDGQCWNMNDDPALVTAAIAHVRSCFYVHQRRIVLAGFSSGGMLAYKVGLTQSATFAGILVENSGLSAGVGGGNVESVLAAAPHKLPIAHTARLGDDNFPIDGVRADNAKLEAAGFELDFREVAGEHGDTTGDWAEFLLPHVASMVAP
jgi:poly(3-hydroxybutyrate) depolymerase